MAEHTNPLNLNNSWIIRDVNSNYFLIDIVHGTVFNLSSIQIEAIKKSFLNYSLQRLTQKELKFINKLLDIGALVENSHSRSLEIVSSSTPHLYRIHWEITGLCNLMCKHCYNAQYNTGKNDLSLIKIGELLKEMNKMNVFRMQISGGEPFLRSDLFEIFNYIYENKMHLDGIFTNATVIDDKLAKQLKYLPWNTEIVISLDGITQTHDDLRGFGAYKKAWAGIKNLDKNGVNITINTMLYKNNKDEIDKLYDKNERADEE